MSSHVFLGYFPEKDSAGKEQWPLGDEKTWKEGMNSVSTGKKPDCMREVSISDCDLDVSDVTKSFINHVQTSLARQPYNLGKTCFLH